MAKTGKGSTGLLLAAGLGLAAFAFMRQGQATVNTLSTARLKGFELKGWNGTTLSALAHVEFNNTNVNRDVQLQDLGLNVDFNGTSLGTAHLTNGPVLTANQNTTLPIPVTMNVGSLLAALGPRLLVSGKLPALKSFTLSKLVAWLQENVGPEELRMQGTAKVSGAVVSFDKPIDLTNYLPSAPRTGEQQLPTRPGPVRSTSASAPGAGPLPATVRPTTQPTKAARAVQTVTKAAPLIKQAAGVVRQVTSTVKSTAAARKARPANAGKAKAGKVRQPVKPPAKPGLTPQQQQENDSWNSGW